ncbi:hypothetical protein SAMN02787142_7969 [Burkholderia sp. WP9]|uniref:hypothetical protein n=1 Tax=Burkholderia sp. WP9 TaxID=1500263 RepID=UPI00089487BE|nr:hypothetical protein [Burkholderia sp. WP9]SEF13043.1 hypothetical protein SAMN02787142_7969 [Burkholderia sp. WP9]
MPLTDETLRKDHAALRLAIELPGFDCNRVIAHLRVAGKPMWRELPFQLASVSFDSRKAAASGLSEHGQREVNPVFNALRNCP